MLNGLSRQPGRVVAKVELDLCAWEKLHGQWVVGLLKGMHQLDVEAQSSSPLNAYGIILEDKNVVKKLRPPTRFCLKVAQGIVVVGDARSEFTLEPAAHPDKIFRLSHPHPHRHGVDTQADQLFHTRQ